MLNSPVHKMTYTPLPLLIPSLHKPLLQSQPIPHPILTPHHPQRNRVSNPKKHKQRPLPPKRVNRHAKYEPIRQFRVGEEIEGSCGCHGFQPLGHVDPALHPVFVGAGERIDEEHEEESGVDAYVVVSYGADGVDVGAVVLRG